MNTNLLRKKISKLLEEAISLDVKPGDVILTGRFKNKRRIVKSIGTDKFGQPTINGKSILKFKIEKKMPKKKWSAESRAKLTELKRVRELIKGVLLEGKSSVTPEKYGIHFFPLNEMWQIVLLDKEKLNEFINSPKVLSLRGVLDACVCGYAEVEPYPASANKGAMYGAQELIMFAAAPGMGPDFCDYVMALIWEYEKSPIVLDRESVSKEMEKLSNYYLKNRSDVEKMLLDDITDPDTYPRTRTKNDDGRPSNKRQYQGGILVSSTDSSLTSEKFEDDSLNYVYKLNNSSQTQSALACNETFEADILPLLQKMRKDGKEYSYSTIATQMYESGNNFFFIRYRSRLR